MSEFIRGEQGRKEHSLQVSKLFPESVALQAAKQTMQLQIMKDCEDQSYCYYRVVYYDQAILLEFYRRLGYEESEYLYTFFKAAQA
jgi:hypothetical protein